MTEPKAFRGQQLTQVTNQIGVYALCDLDGVPVYVGQSTDGIRARVQRHLTSARSDIIANRMIDVWEIAFVWAWPAPTREAIPLMEAWVFHQNDPIKPLMNGKLMPHPGPLNFDMPSPQIVQVIEEDERCDRLRPALRLPRQIAQYLSLVDYIQTVKDEPHLKRSLRAHFDRMVDYHNRFLG